MSSEVMTPDMIDAEHNRLGYTLGQQMRRISSSPALRHPYPDQQRLRKG
jgi:hypothetical protein